MNVSLVQSTSGFEQRANRYEIADKLMVYIPPVTLYSKFDAGYPGHPEFEIERALSVDLVCVRRLHMPFKTMEFCENLMKTDAIDEIALAESC